ncbi:glutamate decarboxylase 1-like [Cryptomeria japonica]|uniref:glutamate decarboxylase 1-like n=1 Tax=Cryptomeria japonica TaxID=3369 RepID=UPI0027DA1670|nr:glutamate decarboxylase 1-like [Cryptomeria japonica]
MDNCRSNAKTLTENLERTGKFKILSKDMGVRVVAFSLKDNSEHNEYEISDHLRKYGWIVLAYTMAPDAQHVTLPRVVVREDFKRTLADVDRVSKELEELPPKIIHAIQGLAICEEGELKKLVPTFCFAVLLLVKEEEEATTVGRFGTVKLAKRF